MEKHPSKDDLAPLLHTLGTFRPIGKGIQQYMLKNSWSCTIAKGKYLVRSGEQCDAIYFIKTGLLRGFIKEKNKEITTWFALENELVAPVDAFVSRTLARENIQAIEDCKLIAMKITDLDKLYIKYPSFNLAGRKIAEMYYAMAENRTYILRLHDAERKYELFLQYYSHIATRIKLTYIASFLGITIETLSRVRSKTSRKKL